MSPSKNTGTQMGRGNASRFKTLPAGQSSQYDEPDGDEPVRHGRQKSIPVLGVIGDHLY